METFTNYLFTGDGGHAALLLEQLFADGMDPESIMLGLMAPAARHMGALWADDRLNFVEVTLGMARLQHLLRQFRMPPLSLTGLRGRVLLAPTPGEQHSFGLRLVEEFLLREGWQVTARLAATETDIIRLVSAEPYDIVGFSLAGERLLPALRAIIGKVRAAARNPEMRILAGGVLFSAGGPSAADLGADAVAGDAAEAVQQANRWLALAGAA
ncbi:MAG: B12-binding domain-containing protein [Aestuariivirga sp.]|uniref:cobalamin B12-binding domain-containing protein n=1 Tax=Aestuariivirga sp. TaxID=2650926 RepID=UPI0038CFC367